VREYFFKNIRARPTVLWRKYGLLFARFPIA
jgi:hypothetical protein